MWKGNLNNDIKSIEKWTTYDPNEKSRQRIGALQPLRMAPINPINLIYA